MSTYIKRIIVNLVRYSRKILPVTERYTDMDTSVHFIGIWLWLQTEIRKHGSQLDRARSTNSTGETSAQKMWNSISTALGFLKTVPHGLFTFRDNFQLLNLTALEKTSEFDWAQLTIPRTSIPWIILISWIGPVWIPILKHWQYLLFLGIDGAVYAKEYSWIHWSHFQPLGQYFFNFRSSKHVYFLFNFQALMHTLSL